MSRAINSTNEKLYAGKGAESFQSDNRAGRRPITTPTSEVGVSPHPKVDYASINSFIEPKLLSKTWTEGRYRGPYFLPQLPHVAIKRTRINTMNRTGKLTAKQATFLDEYLTDLDATQAAIRGGYSKRAARQIGDENMSKPAISAAIAEARAGRSVRTEIIADRVVRELARIAFFDVRKAFNPDGTMKPLDQLDDDAAAAIAGIEVSELRDGDGNVVGVLKKLKICEKLGALDKLGRFLGMWNDKLKLQGDAENPLMLLIQRIQGSAIRPVIEGVVAEYDRTA